MIGLILLNYYKDFDYDYDCDDDDDYCDDDDDDDDLNPFPAVRIHEGAELSLRQCIQISLMDQMYWIIIIIIIDEIIKIILIIVNSIHCHHHHHGHHQYHHHRFHHHHHNRHHHQIINCPSHFWRLSHGGKLWGLLMFKVFMSRKQTHS